MHLFKFVRIPEGGRVHARCVICSWEMELCPSHFQFNKPFEDCEGWDEENENFISLDEVLKKHAELPE